MKLIVILCLLLGFAISFPAAAEKRVALVIGNANYVSQTELPNDLNDAKDMADVLRGYGFKVIAKMDADLDTMLEALDELSDELKGGGVGLVYYSGHGLEVDGQQYIVPVDAHLTSKTKLPRLMINVNDILAKVGESKSQLNVVILDACRNNPYAKALGIKALNKGFSQIQNAPSGTLIASATAVGDTSSAAGARNSVYTAHLLQYLRKKPNDEIRLLLGDVGTAVKTATGSDQVPWVSGSIDGRFYLVEPEPTLATAPAPPAITPPPVTPYYPELTATPAIAVPANTEDILARLKVMDALRDDVYKHLGSSESFYHSNCPRQLAFWQQAAEQGLAIGQHLLAGCYYWGGGVAKDTAQAVALCRKAAEQGDANGQFGLGVMHYKGEGGLPKDAAQAVAWFRKAAEQGLAAGQYGLGGMYYRGEGGLPKDAAQAVAWFRKAAEQGLADAQKRLAELKP